MSPEEIKRKLMFGSQSEEETYIESVLKAIGFLCIELKESDPRVFLSMPASTFDFLVKMVFDLKKEEINAIKNAKRNKFSSGSFSGLGI